MSSIGFLPDAQHAASSLILGEVFKHYTPEQIDRLRRGATNGDTFFLKVGGVQFEFRATEVSLALKRMKEPA